MNQKPLSLSFLPERYRRRCALGLILGLVAGLSAVPADERTPAADSAAAQTPEVGQAAAGSDASATELLTDVRTRLEGLQSLQCELHQTAIIAGVKLAAVGRCVEASGNRVRLEYQVFAMTKAAAADLQTPAPDAEPVTQKPEDARGTLLQVSDGSALHTQWTNGESIRVTRRNINDILKAAETVAGYDPQKAAMDMGIGGLRGLIARIQTAMDFAPVKTVTINGRDYLEIMGRWNETIRTTVFALPKDTVTIPLPQIPEYVRLLIDPETRLPRRIQYLKRNPDPTAKTVRPMLTLDLRGLKLNEPVDDQLFVFTPPENTVAEDLTQDAVTALQQAVTPPAAAETTAAPPQ
jgi:hypothetical protein